MALDETNIVAYMAVNFKGLGWVEPSSGVRPDSNLGLKAGEGGSQDDKDASGPPGVQFFTPLTALRFKISRPYAGVPSSGGPQSAQRSDHPDVTIERFSDSLSPKFLEYSASGKQLAWVHFQYPQHFPQKNLSKLIVHLRLKDAFISSYDFSGEIHKAGLGHIDRLTFRYTAIHLRYIGLNADGNPTLSGDGGWSAGSGQPFV